MLVVWGCAGSVPAWGEPPAALQQGTSNVLSYFKSISGRFVISGIHNREPNSQPTLQTAQLAAQVGRYPALWSGDFLFSAQDISNRWTMIRECRNQWNQGAIVQLMMHVAPPNQPEVCAWNGGVLSHLSDPEWRDLITGGGGLNKVWKARLDGYAVYLDYLKQNGVQVLFRPFHEMNQTRFWWGGRKGPEGTAKLYRLTHDHLVGTRGVTNLIWEWDMQDMSRDFSEYNPGEDYWDIFAFDVYSGGYDDSWYEYALRIAGNKPMGIGECAELPTTKTLASQPRWCFFMSWAELTFSHNPKQQLLDLYHSSNVITRERLPRFRNGPAPLTKAEDGAPQGGVLQ